MKKLLMGSAVITAFSLSIIAFQMSCQKPVNAQSSSNNYILPYATTNSLGGVIIGNGLSITSNGTLSVNTSAAVQQNKIIIGQFNYQANHNDGFYIANYDGTNKQKINIPLPIDSIGGVTISPDMKTVFISTPGEPTSLYSCNFDGTNLKKLFGDGVYDYQVSQAF